MELLLINMIFLLKFLLVDFINMGNCVGKNRNVKVKYLEMRITPFTLQKDERSYHERLLINKRKDENAPILDLLKNSLHLKRKNL